MLPLIMLNEIPLAASESTANSVGHVAFAIIGVTVLALIFAASLFFIILVTYLGQWDIYYPPLGKWLKTRRATQAEKVRAAKKKQKWLEKNKNA